MDLSTVLRKLQRSIASFAVVAIVASLSIASSVSAFSDVSEDAWYFASVTELADAEIVDGSAAKFNPAALSNRAEFAKIVVKAAGVEDADLVSPATPSFKDVKSSDWFFKYVETAKSLGFVSGNPDGTFAPARNVNRAEAAKMLVGALELEASTVVAPFSDVKSTDWFFGAVNTAYHWSVVDGEAGKYSPARSINRAEMSKMVVAAMAGEERTTTPDGTTPPPAANGSVSVSSGTMATAMNIPKGANMVKVGEFQFTAASSADATIKSVIVKRNGPGVVGDILNAYLFDGAARLTSGRTFNSSSNEATFTVNVAVAKGTTKTLGLYVSLSTTAASNDQHSFSLESMASVTALGGTVAGSFPISTNLHTVGGAAVGTITLTKTGSISNPRVGDVGAKVGEVTLAAATEDAYVKQLTLTQGGSVANSALSNFKLKVNGDAVATGTSIGADNRLVLTFATPFKLERGNSRIFELYGDIAGRPADTIIFYVEEAADLMAVGGTFNTGMTSTVTGMDTTGEAHTLTLQGGAVTLTFVGPTSQSVSNSANDQLVWEGKLTTINAIEVKNWRVKIQDTDGTDNDLADAAATAAIQDIKIWDLDKKVVIAGPKDLIAEANHVTETLVFADSVNLDANSTTRLGITVDIKNNPSNITLLASLVAFASNDIRNTTSNTYLTPSTDISPSTDIPGQSQTIAAASLTVATAPSPADHTEIKGAQNRDVTAFNFTTGAGGKVKVNAISVTAGTSTTNNNSYAADGTDGVAVSSLILSASLWDGDKQVGTTKSFSSGVAAFDNLNWTLNSSETRKLSVRVSTNSAATLLDSNSDYLRISLAASSVSAVNDQGNTIASVAGLPVNAADGAGDTVVTIASVGSLTSTLAPTSPSVGVAVAGAADKVFAAFKFQATDENFLVKKFRLIPLVSGSAAATSNDLLAGLKVRYPLQNGTTAVASVGLSGAVTTVDLSASPMYVPQNGTATLEVVGDLATFTLLDGSEDKNLTFSLDADDTGSVNIASGSASNTSDAVWSTADVSGNAQYVFRTVLNAAKGVNTPDNSARTRDSSQNVASLLLSSTSSTTSAVLRGSRKATDAAATGWIGTGGAIAASSTTAVSGTSSIKFTEAASSAANDHFDFDFGASAGLNVYTKLGFWIRSNTAKAAATDMTVTVSSNVDASDDASLTLTQTGVSAVALTTALAADTWHYVEYTGLTLTSASRYVTFNIAANADNDALIYVDDLRFYNDSITANFAGSLNASAPAAAGIPVYLKDNSGTVRAYGALNNGTSVAAGTAVLVAGNGADVSTITNFADIEVGSTATALDVVTSTSTIVKADTTANETLSVSFTTGTPTSAGNFAWYDNSDVNGSNDMAPITVASPTSTTISFSNNY